MILENKYYILWLHDASMCGPMSFNDVSKILNANDSEPCEVLKIVMNVFREVVE